MTFLEQIKIYHDKYLEELSKQVSNKWGINQEDILKLWENGPPPPGPPPSSPHLHHLHHHHLPAVLINFREERKRILCVIKQSMKMVYAKNIKRKILGW